MLVVRTQHPAGIAARWAELIQPGLSRAADFGTHDHGGTCF